MCERIQQFHLSKLANVSELRELFAISVSKQQKHQNWEICNFRQQTAKASNFGKISSFREPTAKHQK